MEIEYFEGIKDDITGMIESDMKYGSTFEACVARVIYENYPYTSEEKPVEMACEYVAIGAYTVITNNVQNLDLKVLDKIKQSYRIIKSGKYDKYFTQGDKKYIKEDIELIENSDLLK